MKVYVATSGEYSDYGIRHIFARREDADAYACADNVEEWEVLEGSVETRLWHHLMWTPEMPDSAEKNFHNPWEWSSQRDFDGHPDRVVHHLEESPAHKTMLHVSGWDLQRVRKVYSEQRAQYIATH